MFVLEGVKILNWIVMISKIGNSSVYLFWFIVFRICLNEGGLVCVGVNFFFLVWRYIISIKISVSNSLGMSLVKNNLLIDMLFMYLYKIRLILGGI